jgi:hypothetical protein
MIKLFITAFLQVFFVSANTYFLARVNWIGVAVCGWTISWLWASNVRKISIGNMKDRIIYSTGAMFGGLVGLYLAVQIWR